MLKNKESTCYIFSHNSYYTGVLRKGVPTTLPEKPYVSYSNSSCQYRFRNVISDLVSRGILADKTDAKSNVFIVDRIPSARYITRAETTSNVGDALPQFLDLLEDPKYQNIIKHVSFDPCFCVLDRMWRPVATQHTCDLDDLPDSYKELVYFELEIDLLRYSESNSPLIVTQDEFLRMIGPYFPELEPERTYSRYDFLQYNLSDYPGIRRYVLEDKLRNCTEHDVPYLRDRIKVALESKLTACSDKGKDTKISIQIDNIKLY